MEYKNNEIMKYEKGLEKQIRSEETWEQNLESLKKQIQDMCLYDPINKIGNFI